MKFAMCSLFLMIAMCLGCSSSTPTAQDTPVKKCKCDCCGCKDCKCESGDCKCPDCKPACTKKKCCEGK